ncbi:MAG: electron transfer flavoprotein subunit beta/FixA family protein [Chloroflexi bacterium]|nr:electron transfer flavoprotein subunit beta/FixA family protein [Chloroflexota bacterium]
MKIVVCVKQVPDSAAAVAVESGQVSWGDAPLVINPWDEFAVEAALLLAEEHGGEVIALTMGGEHAQDALKHALAMGCDAAVHMSDDALENSDTQGTAQVLAAAVNKIDAVDMVLFGKQAIDGDNAVTASQTARYLGWPALTLVSVIPSLDADAKTLRVERAIEEGRQVVDGPLPAVLSIVKDYAEPRYPSFMGIRKASKAEIPIWSLGDLGLETPQAVVSYPEIMSPPTRAVTNEIIEGDSPEDIAGNLADRIMSEKVL